MANADTGNGATIVFASSGWTGRITRIDLPEIVREALENSDLLTQGFQKWLPGDLPDAGTTECDIIFRSDQDAPPHSGDPEMITITFPLFPGTGSPATFAGSGFLTNTKFPELQNNVLQTGSFTIRWDGETGPAYTKAVA